MQVHISLDNAGGYICKPGFMSRLVIQNDGDQHKRITSIYVTNKESVALAKCERWKIKNYLRGDDRGFISLAHATLGVTLPDTVVD